MHILPALHILCARLARSAWRPPSILLKRRNEDRCSTPPQKDDKKPLEILWARLHLCIAFVYLHSIIYAVTKNRGCDDEDARIDDASVCLEMQEQKKTRTLLSVCIIWSGLRARSLAVHSVCDIIKIALASCVSVCVCDLGAPLSNAAGRRGLIAHD